MSPEHTDHPHQGCPSAGEREILSRVGDKWSLEIVRVLHYGPVRFNELKRGIPGISQRMLTLTLRGLERDGLVSRAITPTRPPRVDYELTPLGVTLKQPVEVLIRWAMENQPLIQAAREKFDAAETAKPAI